MSFNNHSIIGKHALLSPSNYHWLDYDEDKMRRVFYQQQAVKRGTELHEYAQMAIKLGVKQAESNATLNAYINDAIGYRMQPEVPLVFSPECFGTADALGFRNNLLRVHDLKTGVSKADMRQLKIYAGIFCFEYEVSPLEIEIVLRIYQNDEIEELVPDSMEIIWVMDRIQTQSELVAYLRKEGD